MLMHVTLLLVCPLATHSGLLDDIWDEKQAKQVLEPLLGDLKQLDHSDVELVVRRQWYSLAQEILVQSHLQKVDLSAVIRKGVRNVVDSSDELLKSLNPKYGKAQVVAPAFQWAQNDTCVFLNVKYTVRWNAPGSLDVKDVKVNLTKNTFSFTGTGTHSNNVYQYQLILSFFDYINSARSTWSTSSVGKLTATIRKRWGRKWPRLLDDKKQKIGNMHVWRDMQESADKSMEGTGGAQDSPVTCQTDNKAYCLPLDTCMEPKECRGCPQKDDFDTANNVCAGYPYDRATLAFTDVDMDVGELGGDIKIYKPRNEADIEKYALYWGMSSTERLRAETGEDYPIGTIETTGTDLVYRLKKNAALLSGVTHILVFSENSYGQYPTPGSTSISDVFLPNTKPQGILFEDTDGDLGEISGQVTILQAADESTVDDYGLHWGKSATKKIQGPCAIRDVAKNKDGNVVHPLPRNTKILGTHLLAFSKNEHGEMTSGVSVKVADRIRPCFTADSPSCVLGVEAPQEGVERGHHGVDATLQEVVTVTIFRAPEEANITHYALYWGTQPCPETTSQQIIAGIKNGHIVDVEKSVEGGATTAVWQLPLGTVVTEETTHMLVFSKHEKLGESIFCKSAEFKDPLEQEEAERTANAADLSAIRQKATSTPGKGKVKSKKAEL